MALQTNIKPISTHMVDHPGVEQPHLPHTRTSATTRGWR